LLVDVRPLGFDKLIPDLDSSIASILFVLFRCATNNQIAFAKTQTSEALIGEMARVRRPKIKDRCCELEKRMIKVRFWHRRA
jgi:hypothetical protein